MLLLAPNRKIAEGDDHYRDRHEGRTGARADPVPISRAITAYEAAAEERANAEARWKLARALYFRATYTGLDAAGRLEVLDRARRAGDEALASLAERAEGRGHAAVLGRPPEEVARALHGDGDAAPSFFWSAVAWGEWALAVGKVKAARTGAATRIRDDAATVIALDPDYEEAGGHRILGRLHHQAPRIPLLTGWVSREEALRHLRAAVRSYPRNFVNRLFLAEALADGGPAGRAEAIRIAREILRDAPSPGHLVEEAKIQMDARRDLAAWSR
jgi:tetratricopeptide (TPR) repeat protein